MQFSGSDRGCTGTLTHEVNGSSSSSSSSSSGGPSALLSPMRAGGALAAETSTANTPKPWTPGAQYEGAHSEQARPRGSGYTTQNHAECLTLYTKPRSRRGTFRPSVHFYPTYKGRLETTIIKPVNAATPPPPPKTDSTSSRHLRCNACHRRKGLRWKYLMGCPKPCRLVVAHSSLRSYRVRKIGPGVCVCGGVHRIILRSLWCRR